MQEDSFPAAEKILSDVENILRKDDRLKSFEILPVSLNENKSPVHHDDHCLGLESWCVKHVYCHAYNHVISLRKGSNKISDIHRTNTLLIGAILLKPDVVTFWNMRKELLIASKLDPEFELHFTRVVLSHKPKCPEAFYHRKWLLENLLKDHCYDLEWIEREMGVCEVAADRYSNNYHAWTHRIWCLSQAEKSSCDISSIYWREWKWSEEWMASHVSDYSGFHYRQFVLRSLCGERVPPGDPPSPQPALNDALVQFLKALGLRESHQLATASVVLPLRLLIFELLLNTELVFLFPSHEALWNHRRFVLQTFKKVVFNNEFCERNKWWGCVDRLRNHSSGRVPEKNLKLETKFNTERLCFLLSCYEDQFLQKCSMSCVPQTMFADKHKLWLNKLLKLQLPELID